MCKQNGNASAAAAGAKGDRPARGAASDEERSRELEVFRRTVGATAESSDLPGILDRVLRGVRELTGLEGGAVCALDAEAGTLRPMAALDAAPGSAAAPAADPVKVGTRLCGSCGTGAEPLVLGHAALDSEEGSEPAGREGVRFHAALPLLVGGRRTGALCVFTRSAHEPHERTLELVQDLCGTVALTLENERVRGMEQAARTQAEAGRTLLNQVFERVTDAFVALDRDWRYTYVNARAGEIFGRRPEDLVGKHIWTEFPEGVGQPFHLAYERAMREQRPLRFDDYYPPYDRWFENIVYPSPDGLSIYFHDITDRKRAEGAVQGERDFSQGVLDSLPGVLYCYDEDLHFRIWNSNFERVTGYSADEITRMSPLDFFAGDEKGLLAARIREVFDAGASDVEADFVAKDGTHTPYYFTGRVTEIDGRRHLVGVGVDISARRAAEAALRDSEERLRMALDAAHMGTFDWDIVSDHISWTRRHEELWGFASGEFPGTLEAFSSRLHPDDAEAVNAEMARSRAHRDQFVCEFRVVWPDGDVHWVIGRGEYAYDESGEPVRMNGVVVETTQLREAEKALAASEAHYRGLFEQAPDGVFLSDPEGRYLDVNAAGCALLGYSRDELLGLGILDVIEPGEAARLAPRIAQPQGGSVVKSDWRFVRKDGSGFLGEVTARQLPDGRLQAYVRDITERRRAENEIRELNATLEERVRSRTAELAAARDRAEQADRLKSAFLATMSHELRTPLNSVIGFTGILVQELAGPLNDEQRKQLGMVQGSARHLLALINDVLDLSKIEAGELRVSHEPFAVDPVVRRVIASVAPLAGKKGLDLRLEAPEHIGMLVGDERRLEQILLNLLGNAVKFTERGGIVLRVLASAGDPPVVGFAVRDTGVGIAPGDLASLFKPFRQLDTGLARRHEGTGLGLAICKRLAELLGGRISVTSTPGSGSEFTLSLPRGEGVRT